MSFSASRLTCYAVLSSIEEDLRSVLQSYVSSESDPHTLLGDDIWNKTVGRLGKDQGIAGKHFTLDDLLPYVDFAEVYQLLNTHSKSLPSVLRKYFKDLTPIFERLVPIRNRVAHSRPLDFDDLATVLDCADFFLKGRDYDWANLAEAMHKLKLDSSFVLSLTIPSYESESDNNNNLPPPDFDETGFIGRRQQISQLIKLCHGPYPVITIVGDGGLGKTALALKIAYEILDLEDNSFDAIVWASTKTAQLNVTEIRNIEGAIQDSLGMLKSVAHQLAGENISDPLEEVISYLAEFRILLILDNLETVLDDRIRNFLGRLPLGSKVLITSRIGIGAFEYPVKLQPMDESDAIQLVRALAKIRDVKPLVKLPNNRLAQYCQHMKNNPGYIKWFVSAVQAGRRPEEVLANPDLFLNFCMSNVYEYLTPTSRTVLRAMLCLPELNSQAELHFLTQLDVLDLQRALQQLLTTNMVVMSSVPRGSSFESRYEISELARSYLSKHHPIESDELRTLTRQKRQLIAVSDEIKSDQTANPYSAFRIATRNQGDLVVARYLIDALKATKRKDYELATRLVSQASDLAPEYFEVRRVEAWVHASIGNISSAKNAYEAAIELEPQFAPLRFMYGGFLMRYLDDSEGALFQFDIAATLDPTSYEVRLEQARANLYLKRFEQARELIDSLIGASNLSMWNRRKIYDLHLQYFQRLADYWASEYDYVEALGYVSKLREAYAACPIELLDEYMKRSLKKTIRIAERCAEMLPEGAARQQANEMADWLNRLANSNEIVILNQGEHRTGVVSRLKRQERYGFISVGSGQDLFFHKDDLIDPSDWMKLSAGAKVYFTVTKDPSRKNFRAVAVGYEM